MSKLDKVLQTAGVLIVIGSVVACAGTYPENVGPSGAVAVLGFLIYAAGRFLAWWKTP
jgi:hypothetical protein